MRFCLTHLTALQISTSLLGSAQSSALFDWKMVMRPVGKKLYFVKARDKLQQGTCSTDLQQSSYSPPAMVLTCLCSTSPLVRMCSSNQNFKFHSTRRSTPSMRRTPNASQRIFVTTSHGPMNPTTRVATSVPWLRMYIEPCSRVECSCIHPPTIEWKANCGCCMKPTLWPWSSKKLEAEPSRVGIVFLTSSPKVYTIPRRAAAPSRFMIWAAATGMA